MYIRSLLVTAGLWAAACGEPGPVVQHLSFELKVSAGELPGSFDRIALMAASGVVEVDALDDQGSVRVSLPDPPQGTAYAALLRFAHGPRQELPGAPTGASMGHAHGALVGDGGPEEVGHDEGGHDEGGHDEAALTVRLPLEGGAGHWEASFSAGQLGHPLGALRGCRVVAVEAGMEAAIEGLELLRGEVGQGAPEGSGASGEAEGGEHAHGI